MTDDWQGNELGWTSVGGLRDRPSGEDRVLRWVVGAGGPLLSGAEAVGDPWSSPDEAWVEQAITFEPQVIEVRKDALLTRAGWRKVDIQFLIRDFENKNLIAHTCFLQYLGPRGETTTERSDLKGGTASFGQFWLKPNGVLRLLAVPIAGTIAEGGPLLEGSTTVPAKIQRSYLSFTATQDRVDIQVRAANAQQVSEQMQAGGNAKFSILKVVELGGGVTSTTGGTQTTTGELTYVVRIGRPSLTIAP
jgi:hypothetical protein